MSDFPLNVLDFVAEVKENVKGRTYIRIDGEYLNLFHRQGLGTDLARVYMRDALKEKYGERLFISISAPKEVIPEPPRTRSQIRKERRAALRWGFDWAPPGPLDEGTNPVVRIT